MTGSMEHELLRQILGISIESPGHLARQLRWGQRQSVLILGQQTNAAGVSFRLHT